MKLPIAEKVLKFTDQLDDPHHRYLSWEHCYQYFLEENIDADKACLHLSFYLASWGMYRGSSFLLWKDYLIHKKVVEHILLVRKDFQNIDFLNANDQQLKQIINLYKWIKDWYKNHTGLINGKTKTTIPSPTLITKILLGTVGCIPAYDRLFIAGLGELKIQPKTVTLKGLKTLINSYKENKDEFDALSKKIKVGDRPYPLMKLVDMYFWQIGNDKGKSKK